MFSKLFLLITVALSGLSKNSADAAVLRKDDTIFADEQINLINTILFDFTTHVLQTGKVARATVDSIHSTFGIGRQYTLDYNITACGSDENDCEVVAHDQVTIGGFSQEQATTSVYGILENDVQVVFNPTNFTYLFSVPNFGLSSTDFQRIITVYHYANRHIYNGLELKIANSKVGLSGEFQFSDGHFSVSNVKVLLDLGEVSMKIPSVAKQDFDGTWTDLEPVDREAATDVMELWGRVGSDGETLESRYNAFIEGKINDILAGRTTI